VNPFHITNNIPFPSEQASTIPSLFPYVWLPYIAFDYQGHLIDTDGQPLGRDEYIPLAHAASSLLAILRQRHHSAASSPFWNSRSATAPTALTLDPY